MWSLPIFHVLWFESCPAHRLTAHAASVEFGVPSCTSLCVTFQTQKLLALRFFDISYQIFLSERFLWFSFFAGHTSVAWILAGFALELLFFFGCFWTWFDWKLFWWTCAIAMDFGAFHTSAEFASSAARTGACRRGALFAPNSSCVFCFVFNYNMSLPLSR